MTVQLYKHTFSEILPNDYEKFIPKGIKTNLSYNFCIPNEGGFREVYK